MPRYYCDYCDIYLTHDSPAVRKQHNSGFKHKANVRNYYMQFEEAQTQELLDARIREAMQNQPPPLYPPRPAGPAGVPPPGMPYGPPMGGPGPYPPGPGGMPPRPFPGGPMGPRPPHMGPPGGPPMGGPPRPMAPPGMNGPPNGHPGPFPGGPYGPPPVMGHM